MNYTIPSGVNGGGPEQKTPESFYDKEEEEA